ncbi:hypothetical protein C8A05DRAFT_34070 [Staphylotrichum tortipilum]|uniref:Uncharacterized protein n=1 Tax=Staphylotrichum tortipilum TaxID=2831512 RepID=A0AAN6MJU1_9PEZI|nr:hypothetical protein C8A05DRAFT_34070 [Staphylotrichum longicolle]
MLHELDVKYRHTVHVCDLLGKDEEARRLKLRSMVLSDEASSLKDQLAQRDARIKELVDIVDDVRAQLDGAHDKARRQDNLMQSQAREIANLKEEISAFNAISEDSSKVLSEKLALSREVAVLKPELEHLRSQLAHQKDVLAEKLALERQLNTLEVELANEKRAVQKAAQNQDKDIEAEEELRKQVRDMEKELAKAKRLAEKNTKNRENKASEEEGEIQSLREELAAAEENLAAEKHKAERLAKAQTSTSEMQEEMEQLRESLAEAQKALAAEKRAAQRQAKNLAAEEELEQLSEELAEAREALANEKQLHSKLCKENEQAQVDFEERQQAASDKADRLRSKLRDAQDELKKTRAELERAQERPARMASVLTTTVPVKGISTAVAAGKGIGAKAAAAGKKKRAADEISADDRILMTPGTTADDRPKRALKKRGFDLSMVGGKSEFSITPFLNKTVNLDASPKPGDATTTTATTITSATPPSAAPFQFRGADPTTDQPTASPTTNTPATTTKPKPTKRAPGRPRTKPLAPSSPSKTNTLPVRARKPASTTALEKVTEEAEDGDVEQENRSVSIPGSAGKSLSAVAAAAVASLKAEVGVQAPAKQEPKKKRRKLGGGGNNQSVLFGGEEDEGERVKPVVPAAAAAGGAVGGKRGVVKMGGVAGAAAKGKGVGAVKNAFLGAGFSPLKRDRRGVAASFLA